MVQVQWLKIYTDIFDNEKIKKLLKNRDGDTYCRVWFQLLTLAAKSNQNGAILLGENIPMTIDDLARIMSKTVNKLTKVIQQLCELNMIIVKNDTIYIKNWDIYQSEKKKKKMRADNRNRQREYRERHKKNNVIVMLDNAEEKNREDYIKNRKEESQFENESGFKE